MNKFAFMRKLIFAKKWSIFHPAAWNRYSEIQANEGLPPSKIEEQQELQRRTIVAFAVKHIKFYRQIYANADFALEDIGATDWFENLPIVTKHDLRNHFEEFVNPQLRQFLKISTTGGSTGVPTKTGYDARIPEEIYSWRLQERWGVHPWDDHAYVWRDTRKRFKAKFLNALMWWPTRHIKLDATFLTPLSIEKFLHRCALVKPKLLQGYVGAITQVAQWIMDGHHEVLRGWSPKVVWTTSAPLTPVQRNLIEKAFGAPVCNEYGSCECRWLASQIPGRSGLKVNTEHVFIEFVDENNRAVKAGEYGRTLITNLEDTVFPLIRYENGDRGRWLDYPFIDDVKGRESEGFVLPSGTVINGEYLTTIFDSQPELVRGFRAVQHKDASITIEYIPAAAHESILKVLRGFSARLKGEVPIDFKAVESIPHDRGKTRYVVREK